MSLDDTGEAHGRIITGEGKGKGKGHGAAGFLHGPHATEILVISSVAGVLLMWLTFRKAGGSSSSAAPAVSPTGVTAGDVAGFDQASVQGLTDNLQTFQQANAAAFQGLSDAIGNQTDGIKQIATETSGLNASITNQTTTLTNALTALPQQIASRIPAAQVSVPPAVAPAPPAGPSVSGPQYVTVHPGDTLSGIAARYREQWITPKSIANLNGIRNINLIHPNTQLRIY